MKIVNVSGTIDLAKCIEIDKNEIKQTIVTSGIDATIDDDAIFLNTVLDNENDFVESLAIFVAKRMPIGHDPVTLSCSGEILADRYDVVVLQNKVYLQYYNLVPGELELYTG